MSTTLNGRTSATTLQRFANLTPIEDDSDWEYRADCPCEHEHGGEQKLTLKVAKGDKWAGDRLVVYCHKGCSPRQIADALALTSAEIFVPATIAELSEYTKLPTEFLISKAELKDTPKGVAFAYPNNVIRYRKHIGGDEQGVRFAFEKGAKPTLYGANWRLSTDWFVLVEGESDTLTLRFADIPARGLPGKSNLKSIQSKHIKDITKIVVFQEPNGIDVTKLRRHLDRLGWNGELRAVTAEQLGAKDPSELWKSDPDVDRFRAVMYSRLANSVLVPKEIEEPEVDLEKDDRPGLNFTIQDMRNNVEDAIAILQSANVPPHLFVSASKVVRKLTDEKSVEKFEPVKPEAMRDEISKVAYCYKYVKDADGEWVKKAVWPSADLARVILSRGYALPFPKLNGVREVPFVKSNGTICSTNGYDEEYGYYVEIPADLVPPEISPSPSPTEVAKAKELLDDLIVDFPFASECDRLSAIGLVLLPFIRPLIAGPVPLFYFDAPTHRTGKSLLCEIVLFPGAGNVPPMPLDKEESERRKSFFSKLIASSHAAVIIDNVAGYVSSSTLAAIITAYPQFSDRILGKSEIFSAEQSLIWVMTANNASFSSELSKRAVRIRLDANVEYPEQRNLDKFKHPDIRAWARKYRADLIWASLTLTRAWFSSGAKHWMLQRGDSTFSQWREIVGGILANAGWNADEHFLSNWDEVQSIADISADPWVDLFHNWYEQATRDGGRMRGLPAEKILRLLSPKTKEDACFDANISAKGLGRLLSARNGQIHGGLKLRKTGSRNGQWILDVVDDARFEEIQRERAQLCQDNEEADCEY